MLFTNKLCFLASAAAIYSVASIGYLYVDMSSHVAGRA